MKKIILLLGMTAFLANFSQAQNCTCAAPGMGWSPFTATWKGVNTTVKCGNQFSVNCSDSICLRGMYKCVGTCAVKYSAILKNAAGVVMGSWPSFSFPWCHKFTVAGNYSLEIYPLCGNSKCEPCRFFFTATCTPTTTVPCDCSPTGWTNFSATIMKVTSKVACGFQFATHRNNPVVLDGKYICKGNCVAKYTAVLKNNVTGAIVMNYPSFGFPWTYTFTAPGNYKLEITPICGDKRCQPCLFYYTVSL